MSATGKYGCNTWNKLPDVLTNEMFNSLDHKEALWQQRRVTPIAVLHFSCLFLALQLLSTSTVVAFRAIAGHVDATHASHFHGSCMLVMRGGF